MDNYFEILLQLPVNKINDIIIFSNWKFKEIASANVQLRNFVREDFCETGHPRMKLLEKRNKAINELLTEIERLAHRSIQKVRIHQEFVANQLSIIVDFIKQINGHRLNSANCNFKKIAM